MHYGERLENNNADGTPSLFWKIISEAAGFDKKDRWLKVVRFFWSLTGRAIKEEGAEEEASEAIRKKMLEFWAWTFDEQDFVKNSLGDDYDAFLSEMAGLTILLDKIDKEREKWLLLCAPHVDLHHNAMSFIEYLTKFEDEESIKRIGKIFFEGTGECHPHFYGGAHRAYCSQDLRQRRPQ